MMKSVRDRLQEMIAVEQESARLEIAIEDGKVKE